MLIIRRLVALLVFGCLYATSAFAQSYTYSVYVDSDNNASTGCTVTFANGTIVGAESVLTATVTAGTPPTFNSVSRATCSGGSFGGAVTEGTGAIGVGAGNGGTTSVELGDTLAALAGTNHGTVRLYVAAQSATGDDLLLTTTGGGGGPILLALAPVQVVPTPLIGLPALLLFVFVLLAFGSRAARRRLVKRALIGLALVSGIAGASIFNWAGFSPLATDPAGDATSGEANIDLRFFYAAFDNGSLHFRCDVTGNLGVPPPPPVAVADTYATPVNTALTVAAPGVLGNDTLNGATITANTNPAHGVLTLNADGSFVYTPASGYTGGDSFSYTLNNAGGNSTATVSLTVATGPVAVADSYTVIFNTPLNVAAPGVLGNDSVSTATITANTTPAHGTLALNADGSFLYTPASGYSGPDSFDYTLSNGGGTSTATVSLTIVIPNHAPSFTKGADQTVFEDAGAQTVVGWATAINDNDGGGQTLNFIVSNGNNALFSAQPAIAPNGTLTYTPAANANGTATVSVQLHDNGGTANGGVDTSAIQTFVINVTAVNDAPSFTKGADENVLENTGAHTVAGWATALSAGPPDESAQALSFIVSNSNNALFSTQPAVASDGTLTYTLATGVSGTALVSVQIHDNGGTANGGVDTSAVQTFNINVSLVNNAPSFTKGADQAVLEDAPAQTIANWATAISAGPANESGQALNFIVGNNNAALFSVAPAISPTGTLTYTLAANANGTAIVTVQLHDDGGTANGGVDTSAAQTFNISVTPVNDAPSFTKGADQSVLEDSGAHTVAAWATALSAGPPDESGQTLSFIVSNNNNALFSTQPAVASDGTLTYTLAAGTSGTALVSVQIQDNGGTANGGVDTSAVQTFNINVSLVNHAPSFVAGPDQNVLEDTAPQSVPWATAISAGPANESGQALNFIVNNNNPAFFSVQPAVSPLGVLTYTVAPDANGTAIVMVQLHDDGGTANGGVDTSAPQTFAINIVPVNDAPSFTKGADENVLEDTGAHTVTDWVTALSAGPLDEAGQTLSFIVTNDNNPLFTVQPDIDASGTLTYTLAPGVDGTAVVSVQIHDDGGTANGGVDTSAVQTFNIVVSLVNHAPSFVKGPDQTVVEDAAPQSISSWATSISAGPANESGQTLNFVVTGNTNPALFTSGPAVSSTGTLIYTLAANANGTAAISIQLHDTGGTANGGVDTSASQTFNINVTAVNDPPSFTKGPDQTVLEDSGTQTITNWATAISPGPADEAGQTVTFNITGNTNAALFSTAPAVTPSGTLTFTPAANANGTAMITLTASDNGGTANGGVDTSAPQSFTINVTAVNDAPSFIEGGDQNVLDNVGAQTVNPWATAISAGPANESGQAVDFIVSNDTPAAFSVQPAVSPTGVLTYTPAVQTSAGSLTATVTVQIHDNGGTANGGIDTSVAQTFVIKITHANIAPTLTTPITYSTAGNTQLHVAGATLPGVASIADASGILAKSAPVDTDGPGPLIVVAASGTSVNGGNYSINADGSFTYVPPAGFTGTDSFTFQVSDQATPTPGLATGTASITVGQRVWYIRDVIDSNNPAGGDGRSNNAFDSIAAFNAATTNASDIIYVFEGNTATTPLSGSITLKDGQKLWGQGIALYVAPFGTLVAATNKAHIRSTAASTPAVSVPATAGNRNFVEVRGLDLQTTGATSNAVDVVSSGANIVGVTISDDNVSGATGKGINLVEGGTGTFTATADNDTITATGNGFDATTSAGAGTLMVEFSNNSVVSGATGININGAAGGTTWITGFANNAVSQNNVGTGIAITSAKFDATPGGGYQTVSGGATVVGTSGNGVGGSGVVLTGVSGDLAFTDLDIFADGGAALLVTGTGAVNTGAGTGTRVTVGAGIATFAAAGGPAANVTNATIDLQLSSMSSSNSATTGVNLDTVAGTFSAGSGSTITNATGTDFNINAGNANVTYNGTISDTTGRLVSVTNATGGAISFTGTISDSAAGTGQGIFLNNNTGATIGFSNTLTLSTGANAAFTATGGGTVTASDTGSTLTTTTGTALNVANTTIGAAGLKFKSIAAGTAASGPTNGIVLNNTGTTGTLTVSGTGSAASGGTIQKTGAEGILLTGPANASFSWMSLKDFGTHGISGTTVNNITVANSTLTDAAGNVASDDGIHLINTTGTATITSTTINGARHQGVTIDNFNTNMAGLNMTGSTVTNTPGGDGMLMQMRGTSVLASGTIGTATAGQGNTFSNNSATGLQVNNADTGNITSLNVVGNTVTGNNAGMDYDLSQAASMTVVVQGNTINTSHSQALNLVTSTSATGGTMTATLKANTIGTAGVFDSGSAIGNGIRIANGGVNVNLTIDSNIIHEVPNGRGIDVEPQAYAPNLNVKTKIVNNQIVRPTGTNQNIGCGANVPCPSASIFVLSDSNGLGGFDSVCTTISGNSAYDPTSWPAGGEGAFYFARRTSASNTLRLEGTQANVTAQITATNTITNPNGNGVVDENTSGPVTIVAVGTCGAFP